MFFLLSGEGVTDMGAGRSDNEICEGADYFVGPMAVIVAQIVEARHRYSIFEGACGFVPERAIIERSAELKAVRKGPLLPGKKRARETHYFFNNARVLARMAREKAAALDDDVAAILFRDNDGSASAGRGRWSDKWRAMADGFAEEGFDRGVPMIPKPKSEAWLICAWKHQPYQGCDSLEDRSGNDNSRRSLKKELAKLLQEEVTADLLCKKVRDSFDAAKVTMPSFNAFRARLEAVI